ncbi:MAG: restriction endonuclease, partial [Bifidobacterium sp.]|nr:restriction endonuclease [Bifidobacterium sp.]
MGLNGIDMPNTIEWIMGLAALAIILKLVLSTIVMRLHAGRQLGMRVPGGIRVVRERQGRAAGLDLDGEDGATLTYGAYEYRAADPAELYRFALALRGRGVAVPMCRQERAKYDRLAQQADIAQARTDLDRVIDACRHSPEAFRTWCANVFRYYGWHAETLPGTVGGLALTDPQGRSYHAGCACRARQDTIGADGLARLTGAIGDGRTGLIAITTTLFDRDAHRRAHLEGIDLIDGYALASM